MIIIELRPRLSRYNGAKIAGDREIWIEGIRWGHIEMHRHGRHAPTYTFWNVLGKILSTAKDEHGHSYKITVIGEGKRHDADARSTERRMMDKVIELVNSGVLADPAILFRERDERMARIADGNAEMRARDKHIRDTLRRLHAPGREIDPREREGLALAYKEIFHGDISEPDSADMGETDA